MAIDVVDLREFYTTPLGRLTTRALHKSVQNLYSPAKTDRVLGLGYAPPILDLCAPHVERALAFMPESLGVLPWPTADKNAAALVDEAALPLPDASMDRIVLMHGLEFSVDPVRLLRECWRILTDAGSLIIVVPNRRGLWSQAENVPFGQGHPYTRLQLDKLVRQNLFVPENHHRILYTPPSQSRLILSASGFWESVGSVLFTRFSGLVVMEVKKQLYGGTPLPVGQRKKVPAPGVMPV